MPEKVDKGDSDDAVDVEDQVRLLARRDSLDLECVLEKGRGRKLCPQKIFYDLNSLVRVVDLSHLQSNALLTLFANHF